MGLKYKRQDQKNNKLRWILGLSAALVLLVGGTVLAYQTGTFQITEDESHQTSENDTQREIENSNKQDFLDQQENSSNETPPEEPTESTITLSARNAENNTVIISTNLTSTPSGICTLTITSETGSISQTADIIYTPEYSTCAGFTANRSELGDGIWQIKLTVSTSNTTVTKSLEYTP